MWDDPIKTFEHSTPTSFDNQTLLKAQQSSVEEHSAGDFNQSMEYVKWMVAGVLLGIFVVMTVAISVATYMDIKRHDKRVEREVFDDDGELEMEHLKRVPVHGFHRDK